MPDEVPDDPLARLWDTSSLQDQRELLADTVFPYARIDAETQEIGFTGEGEVLPVREKLVIFLLMRKAMFLRGVIPKEGTTPSEIERRTGIPGGTIRPLLRKLVDEKFIRAEKGDDGGYYVPPSRIKDIHAMLAKRSSKS